MSIVIDSVNPKLTQGTWVDFGGSKFLVAHSSSLRFQRTLARLQQPHRSKIEKGTIDPAQSKELVCKAFSQAIILDWDDVIDSAGNVIPYDADVAYQALQNNPDLIEFIQEVSNNLSAYKSDEVDSLGKS